MRIIQIVCTVVCLGSASAAFAAQGVKQCQSYATACKAQDSIKQLPKGEKLAAIHNCILSAATADGTKGAACVKEQSGRKSQ